MSGRQQVKWDKVQIPSGGIGEAYAKAYLAQERRLMAEEAHLASLKVPPSFTKEQPDTPEARAARAQVLIIKRGYTWLTAWQRAAR